MRAIKRAVRGAAVLLAITACAPRAATGAVQRGECVVRNDPGRPRTFVVAAPPRAVTLGAVPFTAECSLPAAAVERLAAGAAVLYLEGVRTSGRAATVDVYLGTGSTAAGSFTLLPQRGTIGRVPVPLGDALGAALRGGAQLRVTLRAVDPALETGPAPPVVFDRMVFEFP